MIIGRVAVGELQIINNQLSIINCIRYNGFMQTIVRLRNVSFKRAGRVILDDISWTIEQGQHWALLGANASGKTTLLKIITGYEWPTSGSVEVFGSQYGQCNLPELRRHIGWVSTAIEHRLPPDDSAIEIVVSGIDASVGLYRDFSENELGLAQNALEMVSAKNCADQNYGTLAQGEQQRVLIARALINRPALLILDEPCNGLDPAAKEKFLADLSRLANLPDAPTIVMVTHHIDEIDPWISWIMVLKDGEILANGRKADVLNTKILSSAFGKDVLVKKEGLRYYISPL
jgi:iron complex transport system ATP-binding protein